MLLRTLILLLNHSKTMFNDVYIKNKIMYNYVYTAMYTYSIYVYVCVCLYVYVFLLYKSHEEGGFKSPESEYTTL